MMPTSLDYFRAGYVKILPWLDVQNGSNRIHFYGPYAEISRVLEEKLNMRFTFIPSIDGTYGTYNSSADSWNGLVGMILRKEIEIVACPLAMTYNRLDVMKYAAPVYGSTISILTAQSQHSHINVFGYMSVFGIEVWITVVSTVIFLSLFATLIDYSMAISQPPDRHQLLNNFTCYFAGLVLKASSIKVRHQSGRILLAFWWIAVFTLVNVFMGHFKSSMMLMDDKNRITSLADLNQRTDISPMIWKDSAYAEFMNTSSSPHVMGLMKNVIRKGAVLPIDQLFSKENFKKLLKGEVAIVNEEMSSKAMASDYCTSKSKNLYVSQEKFFPHFTTFAMRKDTPEVLGTKISDTILRLTAAGLVNKWLDKMFKNWTRCSAVVEKSEQSLSLQEMLAFFLILPMGFGISAIVLLIEIGHCKLP